MSSDQLDSPDDDAPVAPASGTVSRVIQVMRYLAETRSETSPRALAAGLGLPISTAHRMLTLLSNEGIAVRSGRSGYVPGLQFRRIAQFVNERVNIADFASGAMRRVVVATNESCALCVYDSSTRKVEFVSVEVSSNPLIYRVPLNKPEPVFIGSSGKSILAFLPQDEIDKVLNTDIPSTRTPRRSEDDSRLLQSLEEIRERGWAATHGEKLAGSVGIAAPVFGATSNVVGSLCLTIPESRFDASRLTEMGDAVALEARRVSSELGWSATDG